MLNIGWFHCTSKADPNSIDCAVWLFMFKLWRQSWRVWKYAGVCILKHRYCTYFGSVGTSRFQSCGLQVQSLEDVHLPSWESPEYATSWHVGKWFHGYAGDAVFFPTFQVRVVRFYQSCCPPPPPRPPPPPVSPVCTAGPQPGTFPAQCAPLDLNLGPSQLSVHHWTSTWDLPSSVCTAGPQPGTCPAQCAQVDLNLGPSQLDLNLGPAQLSVHHWTSTAR